MARKVYTLQPPHLWETIEEGGRQFFRFDLRLSDDRQMSFTVPKRIANRYQVLDVLARGGGGVILTALDTRTGNTVLIKALSEYDLDRIDLDEPIEEMVESIRRARHHLQAERRILVRLRNSGCNAVPHPDDYLYDRNPGLGDSRTTENNESWQLDDPDLIGSEPYLVLEFVSGTSLQEIIEDYYPQGIELPLGLRIIDQVAAVLERLHQPWQLANGQTWSFVYQDLKPANVIVDGFGHATVLDFGGCQIVIDGTLVLHGSHSPGHCAPECGQWGDIPILAAADSYSLGMTLFHAITGVNPRKQLPPDRPKGSVPAIPFDMEQIAGRFPDCVVRLIGKCVAWQPPERFQNASEFRAALAPLLDRSVDQLHDIPASAIDPLVASTSAPPSAEVVTQEAAAHAS